MQPVRFTKKVYDLVSGVFVPYNDDPASDQLDCLPPSSAGGGGAAGAGDQEPLYDWGHDQPSGSSSSSSSSSGSGHTVSPLFAASEDGREGYWGLGLARSAKWGRIGAARVGIRLVRFSGSEQLVSWCDNPACNNREAFMTIFSGQDFPQQTGGHACAATLCSGHCAPAAATVLLEGF